MTDKSGAAALPTVACSFSKAATLRFKRITSIATEIRKIRDRGKMAIEAAEHRDMFRGMCNTLDGLFDRFTRLWTELEDYCLEHEDVEPIFPDQTQSAVLDAAKNWYYEAHGFHIQVISLVNPPSPRSSLNATGSLLDTGFLSQSQAQPNRSRILPEISIKKFSGDYGEWATFKQTFETLILEDSSLNDTERFYYLVSYTEKSASDIIKHIPICKENFPQAWQALNQAYDDKRNIACTYLDRLLNHKPASGAPTQESLQAYLSLVLESVTCITNLGIPNLASYLLTELCIRSLDPKTREGFETSSVSETFPTIEKLEAYVRGRYNVLRRTAGANKAVDSKPATKPTPKSPNKFARHALMAHSSTKSESDPSAANGLCFVCKQEPHRILVCPRFKSGTPADRLGLLRRFNGCRNCLSSSHKTQSCPSKNRCRRCQGLHHTELHLEPKPQGSPDASSSSFPTTAKSSEGQSPASTPASFSGHSSANTAGVLLGTIVANLKGSTGESQSFRGVIDPGSQFSFVTEALARKLRKSTHPYSGAISGVNHSPLQNIRGKITLTLLPAKQFDPLETDAIVVPSITPFLPQSTLENEMWEDYRSYELSDPDFHKSKPIHFLVGADIYPDIVTGAPIVIHENGPRLMPTIFGFTVIGRYSHASPEDAAVSLLTFTDLPNVMQRFWETEETNYSPLISPEDEQCERHFVETTYRNEEGRYVVRLPFKSTPPETIVHLRPALNRFYGLESKLSKNEALRKAYCAQMEEYVVLGHMSLAKDPPRYLIPHHAVLKEEAGKAKLRVVFDASFSTGSGSLNDYLFTGPKLQTDISSILLNFRRHAYVLKCDIVKMFRQVLMDPADRCFQQIVWRSSPDEPIRFYELNTVSFGVCSSPFQAIRVLQEHARKFLGKYPEAASVLLNNTYVDDVTAGSHCLEHLGNLKNQLIVILKDAGFELAKWNSNHPTLLNSDDLTDEPVALGAQQEDSTKILGIHWDPRTDTYSYRTSTPPSGCTKRAILSSIARLYDPLGYLGPVVFHAKCTMQRTWTSRLSWDDEVTQDIKLRWEQFTVELPKLSDIAIPRALPPTDTSYQLVCFSDASESGIGATVYLRATQGSNVKMTLIKSKSRVAPLKPRTIPRLELDGALLLAEVLESLDSFRKDLAIEELFCFTDSMIVLAWLKTPPYRLQTYVSNRVQRVLELVPINRWHHVKGIDNPADVLSRGIAPAELKDHPLWWSGPRWCTSPITDWPISSEMPQVEIPELKKAPLALVMVTASAELVDYAKRHSSYTRLVRSIACLRRFISNCRIPKAQRQDRATGPITSNEFRLANLHYIRLIQHFFYPTVFTCDSPNELPSELRKLNVFVDPDGVIRVGGRLKHAPISAEQKHQILLPARSYYTNLVVNDLHRRNHHAGPAALLSTIQQQYWVPRAKNLIRHLKHKCVTCTRFSRARSMPFMGDLPKSRFAGVRPFLVTGVDMAGPFSYRESSNRKAATAKAYLCLFICMSSRALHLEVTTSLSVEAFLDAFDRFTARRGLPEKMLSDGGSNFRGAARYIGETNEWFQDKLNQGEIISHTAHLGTQWSFNPPYAPHFGGSWEVSVRLVKDLLYKAFGGQPFTLPELSTIFTKIEGALNSRPLQPVSSSPDDLEPLTPGHFIIGQPLNALPEPDFSDVPANRLNRWQLIRERTQYFWSRWKREYLNSLQVRQKWDKRNPNLAVGDMVLIMDSNTPPAHWPFGRILEVHPGEDKIVRVATIKTAKGTYKRPAIKLVRLNLSSLHS